MCLQSLLLRFTVHQIVEIISVSYSKTKIKARSRAWIKVRSTQDKLLMFSATMSSLFSTLSLLLDYSLSIIFPLVSKNAIEFLLPIDNHITYY